MLKAMNTNKIDVLNAVLNVFKLNNKGSRTTSIDGVLNKISNFQDTYLVLIIQTLNIYLLDETR